MKISEYIEALSDLMRRHGDLEVETYSMDVTRYTAPAPRLRYRKILNGKEHKARFFNQITDNESRRGEKVIEI